MWAIRFLTGKLAGQEIPLQEDGEYVLGREENCQVIVSDPGVSKKHATLEINEEGVFIRDMNSSNGTFLNGVKIQESEIQLKDKISICKTTFDIIKMTDNISPPALVQYPPGVSQMPVGQQYYPPQTQMPVGQHPYPPNMVATPGEQLMQGAESKPESPVPLTLKNWFKNYVEKIVLPGVYKLPTWLEFRLVIASFLIFFVCVMTALSAIPLVQILNSSITQESKNHAESIAITLSRMNYDAIKDQMYSAASVEYALRRPGVTKAFIVSATSGKILAPSEKAHNYSKMSFVNEGRKKEGIFVKKLDSNTVAAMAPIQFYNQKTNTYNSEAYSVVIYDMGTLAFGSKRTISLLVQNGFIAAVLGLLIFFFLYKMIEFPISSLNRQLSSALKEDSLSVETDYDFPALQNLTTNINSALSRISAAQEVSQSMGDYDRMTEMNQMIEMIGYPTLGVDMESMKIQGASAHFEEEVGISTERILNCNVEEIDDQALKLNLINLLEKVQQHTHEIASDTLEFSGVQFQISAKGIYGKEELAYTLISFIPMSDEQAEAG